MINHRPIVLLYPPPSDPTQSYTSLPLLTAHLRSRGFRVIQKDLGIELLNIMLTREWLDQAYRRALFRAQELKESNSNGDKNFMERFHGVIDLGPYIIAHVDSARHVMRDPHLFYDIRRYQWATRVITLACELASLSYHPSRLTPNGYCADIAFSFEGLLLGTSDPIANLYYELFSKHVIPELLLLDPLLVGISVTYHFQMLPAFTLGRLLKACAPDLHVTIGGAIISRMEQHILKDPTCFEFADTFVLGEGETALRMLAESLQVDRVAASIPNLVRKVNGRPQAPSSVYFERAEDFPCPDYDGLEMEHYLSPEPVLLLPSTRGCYWGRCAFCDVSRNTRRVYRPVSRSDLCANVLLLYRRYGARCFFFCDDAMPLGNMRAIADLVKAELTDVTWQAEARLEKGITENFIRHIREGGCRQLSFGFEANSQRVLDLMRKNNTHENDVKVLQLCANHGIAVNLQTFIGFPTETQEEALGTIDFLVANERNIASFGCGTFSLYEGTPVYNNPKSFELTAITPPVVDPLLAPLDYVPSSGMASEKAKEMLDWALREKLNPIFSTRGSLLGGAFGAHSLLQFSHYEYDTIYQLWNEIDRPNYVKGSIDELIPVVPQTILLSPSSANHFAPNYVALCTETGSQFGLTLDQRRLLNLCDGCRSVGEVAYLWAEAQSKDTETELSLVAQAFTILTAFLRNGLLMGASRNCAGTSNVPATLSV